ncbi:MAG: response regulator [Chitinophagaceae bacterium BSSC1]|nr:MAG: response regulator [Chitinophagaceae bacterium BSSC1]
MSDVRHNVCLIDDDKIYQFTAKMILEATGLTHSIKTFFNGQEAIDYLISPENQIPENLPDVIFLDINMPVMNGWEFLEAFSLFYKELPKQIVVYMVSSSVDESDIQKSRTYEPVTDYVIKPINKDKYRELLSVLAN